MNTIYLYHLSNLFLFHFFPLFFSFRPYQHQTNRRIEKYNRQKCCGDGLIHNKTSSILPINLFAHLLLLPSPAPTST